MLRPCRHAKLLLLAAGLAAAPGLVGCHGSDARGAKGGTFGLHPGATDDDAGFALTPAPAAAEDVLVAALQLPARAPAAWGYGLTGESLLGRYGLTAEGVLAEVAPHLTRCQLRLRRVGNTGATVHEAYDLYLGDLRLEGATLSLHHYRNKLVMVRASLPSYRLPDAPPTADDFLPVDALGFAPEDGGRQTATRIIAPSSGFAAAAWRLERTDARGVATRVLLDAQTGAILSETPLAFDLATVYPRGPQDGALVPVELEGLPGTGYLDGAHFTVYAPGEGDPRVQAPDLRFEYLPHDPADAVSFDQVQSYYGATRALAYFRDELGWDARGARLVLRVNDVVDGRPDNALYVPSDTAPEIRIGRGNEVLTNLGRDTDVVIHEFVHHIVYEHIQESQGEPGLLHEGTADYFAYAINGDPNLGDSIVVAGGPLRTAALPPDQRYDLVPAKKSKHYRGQYWAAALWSMRGTLGKDMDRLVYEALSYMGAGSGLRDAFLALLNADRDLFPLPQADAEAGVFGRNKCLILGTAVARGFAQWLEELDGASCGLDLRALAEASRELQRNQGKAPRGERGGFASMLFGNSCAVVAGRPLTGATKGTLALLALLAVPAVLSVFGAARRSRDDGP